MAEEVAGAAGGAAAGSGGAGAPSATAPMSAAEIAAPGGDLAYLQQSDAPETPLEAEIPDAAASDTETPDAPAAEAAAPEEVNLAALEEGQPEWLAKVTDPAAKEEVGKLLEMQKAFSEKFKDAADLDAFFKELPGGREQVAALQTLSKEVAELDTAIEANTPEGNLSVAERYLDMAPDGGAGLLRAAAQHMARQSPESWNQISAELVNSTLHAAGIGADIQGVASAIAEMRAAVAADDGEAFGRAAGRLLGTPKTEPKVDPNLQRLTERENSARLGEQKAQTESWQFRSEKSGDKISNHLAAETGKALAKVLPASISEGDRTQLRNDITAEIMSQLVADPWLASQVKQLIGWSQGHGSPRGADYSNANLRADQVAFDKATELVIGGASAKLIAKAVAKIVGPWSRTRAAGNAEARDKAKSAAAKKDVGPGPTSPQATRKSVSVEQLRARNNDGTFAISDKDFLNL